MRATLVGLYAWSEYAGLMDPFIWWYAPPPTPPPPPPPLFRAISSETNQLLENCQILVYQTELNIRRYIYTTPCTQNRRELQDGKPCTHKGRISFGQPATRSKLIFETTCTCKGLSLEAQPLSQSIVFLFQLHILILNKTNKLYFFNWSSPNVFFCKK